MIKSEKGCQEMIDNKEVASYIIKNIDGGSILLNDTTLNRVMIKDGDFVKSFICKDNYIFVEVIRELPKDAGSLEITQAVNKLNGETFLEKYYISEEGGKKYFNMSLTYTLHDDIEQEVKVLTKYVKRQAKAAYSKITK